MIIVCAGMLQIRDNADKFRDRRAPAASNGLLQRVAVSASRHLCKRRGLRLDPGLPWKN